MTTVEQCSAARLNQRLNEGQPLVLLDVREARERDFCVINVPDGVGDLHMPMRTIPGRLDEITGAVPPGGSLVVYCHHGVRSMAVAQWLAERGVAGVANLEGGIDDWSLRVDPSVPRY